MKKYEILQDFKGSPDGHTVIQFTKGAEIDHAQIGDDLAAVAIAEKWVKPSKAAEKEAKAKAKAEADRIAAEEQAAAEAAAQRETDIAALQAEITQLKADYDTSASEEEKAQIIARAEAKQAELDALLAE